MSFLETFLKQKMQSIEERKKKYNNLSVSNSIANRVQSQGSSEKFKNIFSIVMIFLICSATATLSVVLLSSLIAAYEKNSTLYEKLNSIEESIIRVESENEKIVNKIDSIKNDPQAIEVILRNKHHFRQPEEVILEESENNRLED